MTAVPPGVGKNDPDAATNGTPGANGHQPANGRPPWPPAAVPTVPEPAGMPTTILDTRRNGRVRHPPTGDLDEAPGGKPPDTVPFPTPVSLAPPTALRVSHKARERKPPMSAPPLVPPAAR